MKLKITAAAAMLSLASSFATAGLTAVDTVTVQTVKTNVFTRMFKSLPPFAQQTDTARTAVQQLGAIGGILDAKDVLTDPIQSITNPTVFSPNNPDNPNMTAGVTFLGQFLDHDITLDKKSELLLNSSPSQTTNFRTAAFDLDSVYGDGPTNSPQLYTTADRGLIKFKVEAIPGSEAVSRNGAVRYDVPRLATGDAVISDFRNDENVILSQLQLAMLRFHNAVTDRLATQTLYKKATPTAIFNAARQQVTWHYQWIILHEFLPLTIGQDRVDNILSGGNKFYDPTAPGNKILLPNGKYNPLLPIEFSVAAYRFGHSQVRPSYRLNFGATGGTPFFAFIFDDKLDPTSADPADLRGGKRAPRRFVDWQTFFKFDATNFRSNKRIDTKLSSVLMALPGATGPAPGLPNDGVQSLASRNLMRHVNFGIPSGQAIANLIGVPALTPAQLPELAGYALDASTKLDQSTPLWYYTLKEAEVMEQGLRLGPVGSRIVGEVFVGLLKADSESYLSKQPTWKPTLPSATAGDFKITDLLNFAGVVPPL